VTQLKDWDRFFTDLAHHVENNPNGYLVLCKEVQNQLGHLDASDFEPEYLWRCLVLLRSLPGIFTRSASPKLVLGSIEELLASMESADSLSSYQYIYSLVNAIEWLTYTCPAAFEVKGNGGTRTRRALVEYLGKLIKDQTLPLCLRMETAWAISWAGISCPEVGPDALPDLIAAERSEPISLLRQVLRATGLRVGYFRSAYSWASISREGGSFIPLLRDSAP
jgi:hypothetical protein